MSIKSFSLLLLTGVILLFSSVLMSYYIKERETTAKILLDSIYTDMQELSYLSSKHLINQDIDTLLPLLERRVSSNKYIKGITIFEGTTPKLWTNYQKITMPNMKKKNKKEICTYSFISKYDSIKTDISYTRKDIKGKYEVVYYIDKEAIEYRLSSEKNNFLVLFMIIPLIIILIVGFLIRKLILIPMKELKQFANNQITIPKVFLIHELEVVRLTMISTFQRLKQEKDDLYKLARTDNLSGISNRKDLEEKVINIIETKEKETNTFALIFIDLDDFKAVNDCLGHNVGDLLLRAISKELESNTKKGDIVARIGGDEFIIIINEYGTKKDLGLKINQMRTGINKVWEIEENIVKITTSIGIALFPEDGTTLIDLMKNADIALYHSKDHGKNKYTFFNEDMNLKMKELIKLNQDMQKAFKDSNYQIYYQPQIDIKSNKIIGAEALIRWIDPEKGFIPPNNFIGLAESNGFILELGNWVLEESLKQKKEWELKNIHISLSINVAAKQFLDPNFISFVKGLLDKYNINVNEIIFEITEYIFINNNENILPIFNELRNLGIKISLDDFGTGYSSLSYIKQFPIDIIKIDKLFLDDYHTKDGAVFLETIIKMGSILNKTIVAEGVETEEQLLFLKEINCDKYQGFLCSQALQSNDFLNLIKELDLK